MGASAVLFGVTGAALAGSAEPRIDVVPRPPVVVTPGLPDPTDSIDLQFPGAGSVAEATRALGAVKVMSAQLGNSSAACSQSSGNVGRYLSCISDALDDFANELDKIAGELPPGMRNVARIVERASGDIDRLRNRANGRLARARTDEERAAIRDETLRAAAATMATAASDIRKTISLIRARDPELATVQRETVFTVAQAVDNVGTGLIRAIEL